MRTPEELSLGHRILTTVIICLLILLAVALLGWCSGSWDEAAAQYKMQSAIPGDPSKWDDQLFALDREAVQDAYRHHLEHLFATAMRAGDQSAFDRAQVGARNARKAYIGIMQSIDIREKKP